MYSCSDNHLLIPSCCDPLNLLQIRYNHLRPNDPLHHISLSLLISVGVFGTQVALEALGFPLRVQLIIMIVDLPIVYQLRTTVSSSLERTSRLPPPKGQWESMGSVERISTRVSTKAWFGNPPWRLMKCRNERWERCTVNEC
jgi:hypothetical protein